MFGIHHSLFGIHQSMFGINQYFALSLSFSMWAKSSGHSRSNLMQNIICDIPIGCSRSSDWQLETLLDLIERLSHSNYPTVILSSRAVCFRDDPVLYEENRLSLRSASPLTITKSTWINSCAAETLMIHTGFIKLA